MEISKGDTKILKGVAILFMLLLHLFGRKEVDGLYEVFPIFNGVPLVYYIGLFGDACVPIYCFASGYGLYITHNEKNLNILKNLMRIFKLLVNFWIVLFIFLAVGFLAGKLEAFPGGYGEFLLNFFLLSNSYNGAWWFLQTYIILVLLSSFLVKIVRKYNSTYLLLISSVIYLVSYVQRIKQVIDFGDSTVLNILVNAVVLVGTSLLPFIVGCFFAKEKLYSKLYSKFRNTSFTNILCLIGIFVLVIIHSLYESMIIAPFTAIAFICFFNFMDKSMLIQKLFAFLGDHSTNIWLTHMFFYMSIFPEITFAPRYPIIIFAWLLILCLISSYIINSLYKPVIRMIDKKISNGPKSKEYPNVIDQKTI
ncbi:acyltransferase family protein [Mesobacillus foraminis]|uniref:acyltransferase family protein n=1 Tax=Mesobacillus foraminis TaxID=279826 RepID=UPI000EF4F2E4|nr:acyltransferase [Mesobacillus foraminis]